MRVLIFKNGNLQNETVHLGKCLQFSDNYLPFSGAPLKLEFEERKLRTFFRVRRRIFTDSEARVNPATSRRIFFVIIQQPQ